MKQKTVLAVSLVLLGTLFIVFPMRKVHCRLDNPTIEIESFYPPRVYSGLPVVIETALVTSSS